MTGQCSTPRNIQQCCGPGLQQDLQQDLQADLQADSRCAGMGGVVGWDPSDCVTQRECLHVTDVARARPRAVCFTLCGQHGLSSAGWVDSRVQVRGVPVGSSVGLGWTRHNSPDSSCLVQGTAGMP